MKITRNTLRVDGLTVGQAMDKDAAFLRSVGIDAKDGAKPYDEAPDDYRDKVRKAVLDTLDNAAEELIGERRNGPKDGELTKLFAGLDPIITRMFNESIRPK